jgi:hypothetical protein
MTQQQSTKTNAVGAGLSKNSKRKRSPKNKNLPHHRIH